MIIIDNEKYTELVSFYARNTISQEEYESAEDKSLLLDHLTRVFLSEIFGDYEVKIKEEQVDFHVGPRSPITSTRNVTAFFKINKTKIALLDNLEKIIEIPANFSPPYASHRMLPAPKVINYGGADTELPYDVIQYWPWGYDLERDVQIWRTI